MFPLDVAKVDLVLHMLQCDPSAAAAWARLHARGCGGGASEIPCGRKSRQSNVGHEAERDTLWAWDIERRGPHMKQHRRANASPPPPSGRTLVR